MAADPGPGAGPGASRGNSGHRLFPKSLFQPPPPPRHSQKKDESMQQQQQQQEEEEQQEWQWDSLPPLPTTEHPYNEYQHYHPNHQHHFDSNMPHSHHRQPPSPPLQQQQLQQQQQQQRPIQTPIHYAFPSRRPLDNVPNLKQRRQGQQQQQQQQSSAHETTTTTINNPAITTTSTTTTTLQSAFASPRNDRITQYMSSTSGKLYIHTLSTMMGLLAGITIVKSFSSPTTTTTATITASMSSTTNISWFSTMFIMFCGTFSCLASTLFRRTAIGELQNAMALCCILLYREIRYIRQRYNTWHYIQYLVLGIAGGRRRRRPPPPFPPTSASPWHYTGVNHDHDHDDRMEFNMVYCTIAMAMVGSICGGNLPLQKLWIPTWVGSLMGAIVLAYGCTLEHFDHNNNNNVINVKGDICRLMGMRVVTLIFELYRIQGQLDIVPKAMAVSSQILDRLFILDRQHHIKDRLLFMVHRLYDQGVHLAQQLQQRQQPSPFPQKQQNDRTRDHSSESERSKQRPSPLPQQSRHSGHFHENEYHDRREYSRGLTPDSPPPTPPHTWDYNGMDYDTRNNQNIPNNKNYQWYRQRQQEQRQQPNINNENEMEKEHIPPNTKKTNDKKTKRGWFGR